MICVIKNGDMHQEELIASLLRKHSIEHIVSNDEQKILSSDKIIIPDTSNLCDSLRKLKLMNMMSVLRLFKKPILGINQGMILMCRKISSIQKAGLGLIDCETMQLGTQIKGLFPIENIVQKNDSVFSVSTATKYYFNTEAVLPNILGSISILNLINSKCTAVYQKDNIYGIQMCLDNHDNIGCNLLSAFGNS